jgi:hypothetical protein
MTAAFYAEIPESGGLASLLRDGRLQAAPDDAWLVCADVRGSTRAIEEGRYKDVNLAGAACITAVLNACGRADLPFIFGGDGAMLLVGPEHRDAARNALAGAVRMARAALKLEMRAGLVSVKVLRNAGAELAVGRVRMSEGFHQAAFMGGAAAMADAWLKAADPRVDHVAAEDALGDADLGGLECRWRGVRPTRGNVAALIIEAQRGGADGRRELERALREVEETLGSAMERRPVSAGTLELAEDPRELAGEAKIVSGRARPSWWRGWRVRVETRIGHWLMTRSVRLRGVEWGRYKADAADNTDFEKLDDALRMVVAADADGLRRLKERLDVAVVEGRIWYGLQIAEECRMTCLVFVRGTDHFHFVDGAGGGYAAAASALKAAKAAGGA